MNIEYSSVPGEAVQGLGPREVKVTWSRSCHPIRAWLHSQKFCAAVTLAFSSGKPPAPTIFALHGALVVSVLLSFYMQTSEAESSSLPRHAAHTVDGRGVHFESQIHPFILECHSNTK